VAAFAVTPPATYIIGVDHQAEMLEMFSHNASNQGVSSETYLGYWPEIADEVPMADVVTCHHVVYNVGEIEPFLRALDAHAKNRVVIELPLVHPTSSNSIGWKYFWNLDRPTSPTADDFLEVVRELGFDAHMEKFSGRLPAADSDEDRYEYLRQRLCLPKSRIDEIREFSIKNPAPTSRELAVVWWDKV
jgi:ubiquinone/menaquinone biosynthesis C-methylase UbiE